MAEPWTISNDEYRRRQDRAVELMQPPQRRIPSLSSWGMFSYGDAPLAIGSGAGAFFWFTTARAMLLFVPATAPYMPPGPASLDPALIAQRSHDIVIRAINSELDLARTRVLLNRLLKGFTQIRWWGQFSELVNGNGAFPREIRMWHRESTGEKASGAPILAPELGKFRVTVAEYGT